MNSRLLILAIVALASLAAAFPPRSSSAEDGRVFGPPVAGLELHADGPAKALRGDTIEVDLRLRVDAAAPRAAPDQGPTIDLRHPAYFSRLRLTPFEGGREIVVVPTDPTAGMLDPPPPEGDPTERPVRSGESIGRVGFPLASRWKRVTPGRFRCVVEFVHEGEAHRNAVQGTWRGTLVSQPFDLEITKAPERFLEVQVPAALLGGGVDGALRLPVRNGFAVGLNWPGGSLGGNAEDVTHFDEQIARIATSRGRPEFTLFETSYLPEHMWHPGPGKGHYRVLWKLR